jgi:aryl-alcohol dehydrogenase-like predicted oxidoreductase
MPIIESMERLLEKRRLGRTELSIAPLVLGGNVFGWTADEKTSFDLLDRFAAAGLNAVDTADSYSRWAPGNQGGESEAIIGKWMKSRGNRDKVIVVTKVGSDMGQGKKDLSAAYIEKAVEASLKRLQTEVIDLYLSHWPDSSVPYDETLGAYQRLIAKGKIRYAGASNLDAGQLAAALKIASQKSLPRYEVLQPEYNLYDRSSFDGALSDLCVHEEIGVITYFSLARGFLSGKYRSEADLGKSPRGQAVGGYLNPRGLRILAALDAVAARHSAKPAEVALAWVIARPGITAPIASATTLPQVESLIRAASLELGTPDVAELDAASAP